MEDLGIEEVKQLVNFYKQKSSDLEFQVLQLQLKLNKLSLLVTENLSESSVKTSKK